MSDTRNNGSLEFKPIDLEKHADLCIAFTQDTHRLTEGPKAVFEGAVGYIERMREKLAADPMSCLFAWLKGEVVGQVNLGVFGPDPSIGYINVFYVTPERRGTGIASEMERYACARLRAAGFSEARLSVAWANKRAVRFYEKHGWSDLGERQDRPGFHNMHKVL